MDIGTAKITEAERRGVPHHLLDILDVTEEASVSEFQQQARALIADVHARGKNVIVCGGTGLYLRVLLHGAVEAPSRDEALRAELEKLESEALHAKLKTVDPTTAARLPIADRVRIIRALEIHALTGKAASQHREEHSFAPDRYEYDLLVLNPSRDDVYAAINARTQRMFDAGLVDETRALVERGFRATAPMRAVGYAQALQVIDGALSVAQAISDTAQATRHYAKRQFTWFKKEKGARFVTVAEALKWT
jgi:tRNA dimethylallyltransferase